LTIYFHQIWRTFSGAQRLGGDDGKQAVGVLTRSNSSLGLSLGYSAASFLFHQILVHDDAETQLFVVNDELASSWWKINLLPDNVWTPSSKRHDTIR